SVPPKVLAGLRESYLLNTRRSLVQAGELIAVVEVLHQNSVPAIAFKGPVTAAVLYEQTALREAGDLDLLIRPEDAVKARRPLLSTGYTLRDKLPEEDSAYRSNASGYAFTSHHHATIIDLQWTLSPRRF